MPGRMIGKIPHVIRGNINKKAPVLLHRRFFCISTAVKLNLLQYHNSIVSAKAKRVAHGCINRMLQCIAGNNL